ncbi:MAG: hypothetical protein WC325_01510 [Candidatus Bathyarchaeia archaeon]|jgi:hypothetical protein
MKKTQTRLVLFVVFCSLLMPLFAVSSIPFVMADEQVFCEDTFENYETGTFPTASGWELWYGGAGVQHQVIVDDVSCSQTKSLKLLGLDFWAGFAAKKFVSSSPLIGFEVSVLVESTNGQTRDNARVAFTTQLSSYISREYAPVTFNDDGNICSGGQVLQTFVAGTWYTVKQVMNRDTQTYSVWVNGELKAENLPVTNTSGDATCTPYMIEAFSVSQCYNSVTVYFDDVKVFSSYTLEPKLELTPDSGIATTTITGTGFAPESKITVTWDEIPVPTVPNPTITDSYGNFTAIIAVLNQTNAGPHTVKAVDETGAQATAIFSVSTQGTSAVTNGESAEPQNQPDVIPNALPLIVLPLLLIALASAVIARKQRNKK